ncbi:hypothetical protein HOD29_05410 [archaeon]|jgi:hypothetical protein|nr:hypothetical protein [archaeon]
MKENIESRVKKRIKEATDKDLFFKVKFIAENFGEKGFETYRYDEEDWKDNYHEVSFEHFVLKYWGFWESYGGKGNLAEVRGKNSGDLWYEEKYFGVQDAPSAINRKHGKFEVKNYIPGLWVDELEKQYSLALTKKEDEKCVKEKTEKKEKELDLIKRFGL